MNDMKKPPLLFEIPKPLAEKVATRNFGMVTMTAPLPAVIERIIGIVSKADPNDEDAPYRALVAECATGENGERFTPDLLARLPGQCFGDWVALRTATIRVCGMNREEVGKA